MNKQTNRQKDITSHCTLAESDDKLKHTASGTVPSKSDGLLVIDVFVDGRGVCPILELYTQQQLSHGHVLWLLRGMSPFSKSELLFWVPEELRLTSLQTG